MKYIIPGQPIPLARPRFSNGHVWDCQQAEKGWAATYLRFLVKGEPIKGPVCITIVFYMKHAKKKGFHNARPDLDNLIKFYMDIANGIIYEDDKQVVRIDATKVYDTEPRTEIEIQEL